jgi:hypothetical protein
VIKLEKLYNETNTVKNIIMFLGYFNTKKKKLFQKIYNIKLNTNTVFISNKMILNLS